MGLAEWIRQSLNHANLATTQRYLHGDVDMLRAALARLPAIRAQKDDENQG